jgi:hypothetical protein
MRQIYVPYLLLLALGLASAQVRCFADASPPERFQAGPRVQPLTQTYFLKHHGFQDSIPDCCCTLQL